MILLLLACAAPEPVLPARTLALSPCHATGLSEETVCGELQVWEDRAAKSGRKLSLRVMVVPAVRPVPEPDPLFFLAGGPGQSAVGVAAAMYPAFASIREGRDLVFVDQRGTGASNPLACEPEGGETLADAVGSAMDHAEILACRDRLDADLRQYTTAIAMDDLDDVRAALGYDRINLYGASYGTRAALVYARRHGEHLRSMVLDGVAPPSMTLFLHFAEDAQASFAAAVGDCAADPGCAGTFPTFGDDLAAAAARLPADVALVHPRTGSRETVTVTAEGLTGAVRALLYSPELTSLLPLDLALARGGDLQPLLSQALTLGGASVSPDPIRPTSELYAGMMMSVVCAEDIPRLTAADIEARAAGTFLGPRLAGRMVEACEGWPVGDLPADAFEPVVSDVPTLLLSGALDPVTPPRWGEEAARHLSHARHLVVKGTGHNVIARGCAPRVVADFVAAGTPDGLDAACLDGLARPPFFLDLAGPQP